MKLSKYLADYIEHEFGARLGGITPKDMKETVQQGIEAFESTEGVKVLIVDKEQRKKQIEEFIKGWGHFCDKIDFGHSFLDAEAIRWMNEIGLRIKELSE